MTEEELAQIVSKISDLGLSIGYDSYIAVAVISVVSAGLGAYFGSYLKKKGQDKAMSEGFRELKERLRVTTKLTEGIKSDVARDSYEYKFKFEKYHEKRIEVIEKLYELLINIERHATDYIVTSDFGGGQNESFKKAKAATEEFVAYSKLRSFWVPKDLHLEIESLAIMLDTHVYSVLIKLGSSSSEQDGLAGIQASDEAINTLKHQVPEAKEKIVENIRRQLDPTYS
ncbi:hypothetical protein [Pseudomonas sp. OIL-1]|uniref:hypothetical protein n=1 Tax=Pseudomonas sp. OIL-1 TaxID=2706126 RepID=UPI0013A71EBC|nr:hypothetical protein [Pseudomonas sp. OIL-1]QIB50363.1 hypothetical protein G3M63_04310 [Pseudomonas sp. OIL-1]